MENPIINGTEWGFSFQVLQPGSHYFLLDYLLIKLNWVGQYDHYTWVWPSKTIIAKCGPIKWLNVKFKSYD